METIWTEHNGCNRAEFTDLYGKLCVLQEASGAQIDAIWFGVNTKGARMHLSREQVQILIPFLQAYASGKRMGEL